MRFILTGKDISIFDVFQEIVLQEFTLLRPGCVDKKNLDGGIEGKGHIGFLPWLDDLTIGNHVGTIMREPCFPRIATGVTGTVTPAQSGDTHVSKWRNVSIGTKIMMTSNAADNEGWFEAVRMPVDVSAYTMTYDGNGPGISLNNAAGGWMASIRGLNGGTQLGPVGKEDSPSYVTGKLRDIGHYLFKLNSTENDHEFIDIKNDYQQLQSMTDDSDVEYFLSQGIDSAFDMLVLNIYGKAGQSFVLHTKQHQEKIYGPESPLSRFMTPNYKSRKFTSHRNFSHKAAIRSYK